MWTGTIPAVLGSTPEIFDPVIFSAVISSYLKISESETAEP